MEKDYAAEIAQYIDDMRIKKKLGGFDKLDTYQHMQELGAQCATILEKALLEKDQTINELKIQLAESRQRQAHPDSALLAAAQQARQIIDATNNFVQFEQQIAQRIFQDKMREQQLEVSGLEQRKKELKAELTKLETVIREVKAGLAAMGGQLAKNWPVPNQENRQ